MHDLIRLGQAEPVLKRITDATQALLGCTISLTDSQWHEASLLPGWTRAHIAAHLSRNADALTALVRAAVAGQQIPLYPSKADRMEAIERGAELSAMDLQIDMDTSAGNLSATFETVPDWTVPVTLPFGSMPLVAAALARLNEVYVHHLDMRCEHFTIDQFDPVPSRWLLDWVLMRLESAPDLHSVEVMSHSGITARLGAGPDYLVVKGTDAALWAWLTGRSDGSAVLGSNGLTWPLLG